VNGDEIFWRRWRVLVASLATILVLYYLVTSRGALVNILWMNAAAFTQMLGSHNFYLPIALLELTIILAIIWRMVWRVGQFIQWLYFHKLK